MINKHINNPFIAERISDGDFNKISSYHIGSLKVYATTAEPVFFGVPENTIISAMLVATEDLYNNWKSSSEIKASEKSVKEGKTINVNDAVKDIKSFISRKSGVIADKFSKGTPTYEEFFPLGLKEYSGVRLKNAERIFKRFITTLDRNKNSFDEAMFTEASEKYNTYLAARSLQLQTFGKVKDGMTVTEEKRYKLGVQLYKNLLTLLLINAETPEKVTNYFDESILKKKSRGEEPPLPPPQL